ncbi:MAG: glycosyltransferase [Nitrospiraceae bacterium]|nr:glycosyltransferase [Nitrospiraceae bacterium]
MIEALAADLRFELTGARLEGSALIGEADARVIKLRPGGVSLCERLAGGTLGPFTPPELRLLARLARRRMLRLCAPEGASVPRVSAIVPALRSRGVRDCLAGLVQVPEVTEVVLVSDGSPEAGRLREIAAASGARFLALASNRGPAGARNAGAAAARGEVLLFVDSDAAPLEGLSALLRLFSAPGLALAAPRVRAAGAQEPASPIARAIADYEQLHSPLDMGAAPGEAGDSPTYVPTACLAIRADEFRNLGGFDERLRYGEDVDLLWRLRARGGIAYYSGSDGARHLPRETPAAFLRQRQAYGSSAAPLVKRHPGRLTHLHVDEVTAAMAAFPLAGTAVRVAAIAAARRRLASLARQAGLDERRMPSLRVQALNALAAELSMLVRALGLPALWLALPSRRVRHSLAKVLTLLALARAAQALDAGRRPAAAIATGAVAVADDIAYSAGLAWGAVKERSPGVYVPTLRAGPLLARMAPGSSTGSAPRRSSSDSRRSSA